MKYVKANSDLIIGFDFMVGDELVVPEVNSVKLYLSDNDGPITSYNPKDISTTNAQTHVDITFPASVNDKTLPTELRYLHLRYTVNGVSYEISDTYMVVARTQFPVTPKDIRDLLGVSISELPSDAIDIVASYQNLQVDMKSYDTEALFTSGAAGLLKLIEALKIRAALDVLPGLPLRALQKKQADNVSGSRFSKVDWEKLEADLRGRYMTIINEISPLETVAATVWAQQAFGTDPVTGA